MSSRIAQGIAGAALLIGIVTVLARLVGFGRYLVQSQTVGNLCLSTAYNTANYVPNIVFELVAGGALAGMVVPVLASAASRAGDDPEARAEAGRITSALLTWVMLVMVPLALLIVAFAGPIVSLLVGDPAPCDLAEVVEVGTGMLVLFAPRMIFFGLAVVLYGVLQAHRRFMGPALAPLVSSLLIVASNLLFGAVNGKAADRLTDLTTAGQLSLSRRDRRRRRDGAHRRRPGGQAQAQVAAHPVVPSGVAARARRLATAGIAVLIAQQVTLIVVIFLANNLGGEGALGVYTYAWALYQLPYAVLVMPIATSSFPVLSVRAQEGDLSGFNTLASSTTRAVLLVTGLAAGVMAAVAVPVSRVFLEGTPVERSPRPRWPGRSRCSRPVWSGTRSCCTSPASCTPAAWAGRRPPPRWPDGPSRWWPRSCSPMPPRIRRTWSGSWHWAARSA